MRYNDPLKYFYIKFSFHFGLIDHIIIGEKYIAVVLINGNIGIAANLINVKQLHPIKKNKPDLNNGGHRILLNAYFNALLNYNNKINVNKNLFDVIDFSIYNNPVMIGYSKTLIKYLNKENLNFHIFDYEKTGNEITDQSFQKFYLRSADVIILTATTIFNKTFQKIIKHTNKECDVFIVGPSSILSHDMFKYKNIKGIFGTIFLNNDERVLNIISNGEGTNFFKQYGTKIALLKNDNL